MRLLFSSSLLLFLCLTARAQTPTTSEKPKDFAFNFSTATNKSKATGKSVTTSEFGNSRLFPDGSQAAFDKAVSGPNGFLKSESIIFIDKNGKELAQLNSDFLVDGKLKSQTLVPKGKPVQVLNWYKNKAQSPDIVVPNSVVRVRYSLEKGFLKQRVLLFTLPTNTRQFTVTYDAKGRRFQDTSVHDGEKMQLTYSYGSAGLVRLVNAATKTEPEKDMTFTYLKGGEFDSMIMKEAGVIKNRAQMSYTPDGKGIGQRMENYEDGILNLVATIDDSMKRTTVDEYDLSGNFVVERKIYSIGKEQTLLYKEEWNNGKATSRIEYAADGRPVKRTIFNSDGTVKSSENLNESAGTPTP